jgi:isoleucyl-tRNA synthetase
MPEATKESTANKPDYPVNLPKTDFPMRAGLTQREPEILARWEGQDLYHQLRADAAGRPKYVLHDGPPYANGELHSGHALNKVLKDLVVRSKQMAGFDAPFVPGWDCHGLPIELKALQNLGSKAKDMSQVDIRTRCREFALKYVDIHREGFKRLGVNGDWSEPYLTLSPDYVAMIIHVFAEIYQTGAIYRGKKSIHWCPSCRTALAEAEVEYADKTSPSIYVKFKTVDAPPGLDKPASLLIWTTTPWTIPSNMAICVHPELEYNAVRVGDEYLILARDLTEQALKKCGIDSYEVVREYKGTELEGLQYRHVFFSERICPVILGRHVTLDSGTGCVHTAPGHGQDDYNVGRQYGIDPFSPVDAGGVFTEEAGPYAGTHVFKANPVIVEDLRANGALLHAEDYTHSYPHCWRCSGPIIFRATPQWFLNMEHDGFRQKALDAIEGVRWIPEWGKERIYGMIAQRPDWCLSRQRAWGVPIPVFYGKESREVYATPESFAKIEALARSAPDGIDRWFDTPASELVPPGAKCAESGETEFDAETDILDVWFDSGASSRAVCEPHPDLTWPGDMYLEGSDQHRGWFQSSLLMAMAAKGAAPFRSVLTHGYVVDGEGKAMSKKLGNYIGLPDMLNTYGADIVRLWVSSENYRQDIRISEEIIKRQQDAYRGIRNAFRILIGNLFDYGPDDAVPYGELPDIDRWMLHQAELLKRRVLKAYDEFEFHIVYHAVHNFCAVDLSKFYVDVLKDRMYTCAADSKERKAGQTVMASVLNDLLTLLAPVLVYTCDEAWQHLPGHLRSADTVHRARFPEPDDSRLLSEVDAARWAQILNVRFAVNKVLEEARRDERIKSSLQAAVTITPGNDQVAGLLDSFRDQLVDLFIVSKCEIAGVDAAAAEREAKVRVEASTALGLKCARCWHVRENVGGVAEHPELCLQCAGRLGLNG